MSFKADQRFALGMSIKRLKGKFRLSSSSSVTSHLDNLEEWTKYDERVLECVHRNDVQKLQETIKKKSVSPVKLNNDGETALHVAVKKSSMTCVDIMLNENPDLSTIDMQGRTVYHIAALNGDTIMLKKLLDFSKLNLEIKDINEMTALHYAVASGEGACVKLLIDYKAPLDSKEIEGRTPLLLAILEKYEKIALTLIESGANINVKDNAGRSAIVVACSLGMCQVVTTLINKGADKTVSDNGRTLEVIAREGDHKAVVEILRSQTALDKCNGDVPKIVENGVSSEDPNEESNADLEKQRKRRSTGGSISKRSSMLKTEDLSFTSSIIESLRGLNGHDPETDSESSLPQDDDIILDEEILQEKQVLQEEIQKKDLRIQELEAQVTSLSNKFKIEMGLRFAAEKEVNQLMSQLENLMESAAQNSRDNDEDNDIDEENEEEVDEISHERDIPDGERDIPHVTIVDTESFDSKTTCDDEKLSDNEHDEKNRVNFSTEVYDSDEHHNVAEGESGNETDESVSRNTGYRKKSLGTAKRHIEILEEKILSLEEELQSKDTEISELESKLHSTQELVDLNNNTTVSLDQFNEVKSEWKSERTQYREENKQLESKVSRLEKQVESLEQTNKKLEASVENESEENSRMNQTVDKLQEEILDLRKELKDKEIDFEERISCYRNNLLSCYQNSLDARLGELLSKIINLRAS